MLRTPHSTLFPYTTLFRSGIVLVTGPTGSGKTTTLYSALNELNEITEKIITTEDPIEYDIDGITQVPINSRSEEHTSELQSRQYLVCRLLLEKKKKKKYIE